MEQKITKEFDRIKYQTSIGQFHSCRQYTIPRKIDTSKPVKPKEPPATGASIPERLKKELLDSKKLKQTPLINDKSSPEATLARDPSIRRSVQVLSAYHNGGFSELSAMLANADHDSETPQKPTASLPLDTVQPPPPLSLRKIKSSEILNNDTILSSGSNVTTLVFDSGQTSPQQNDDFARTLNNREKTVYVAPPHEPEVSDEDHVTIYAIADKLILESKERQNRLSKRSSRVLEAAGISPPVSEYTANGANATTASPQSDKTLKATTGLHKPNRGPFVSNPNASNKDRRIVPALTKVYFERRSSKQPPKEALPPIPGLQNNQPSRQSMEDIEALFDELETELGARI